MVWGVGKWACVPSDLRAGLCEWHRAARRFGKNRSSTTVCPHDPCLKMVHEREKAPVRQRLHVILEPARTAILMSQQSESILRC